jgi:hypothetical protein
MQNFSSSSNFFGTVFFLIPQLLLHRRSARCAHLPPAQSEGRNHCVCLFFDEFFGSPKKNFANERGFDFLDGQTDRQTDGQEFCGNFG